MHIEGRQVRRIGRPGLQRMSATVADWPRTRLIEINADDHVCNLVAAVTAPVRARQLCSAGNAIGYRDFLAQCNCGPPFPGDAGGLASGESSHFQVEEDLDRKVTELLRSRDLIGLAGLDERRLQSCSLEVRTWQVLGGAAIDLGLDRVSCTAAYRTPGRTRGTVSLRCSIALARRRIATRARPRPRSPSRQERQPPAL